MSCCRQTHAYHVNLRALEDGRQPHNIYTELFEVVHPRDYAFEISDTIPIGILKGRRVDLVDGALLPPGPELLFLAGHLSGLYSDL